MVKLLMVFTVLIVSDTSCSKQDAATTDNDCIARSIPRYIETGLTDSQLDSINNLFGKNNLSTSQLQFYHFTSNIYSDPTKPPTSQVCANLFLNDLPVFRLNEVFLFSNGVLDTSYLYTGTPLSNDTTGHQSLTTLRKTFLSHVSEAITYSPVSKPFVPSSSAYLNVCLVATLGYIDVSYLPGNTKPWGTLIKVWSIKPSDNFYPSVYVKDEDGSAWGSPIVIP
jgi:hypothetical protein